MTSKVNNIKSYADEIQTISDFPAVVRKMPGMYIGRPGNAGFLAMIREVYQNSIDEMMKKSSPCDEVSVIYNQDTKEVIVSDNGRGIPFKSLESVFSEQHTSSNYTKRKGEYSSGLHGVGAKVTNALSEYFIVESYINIPGTCEARRAEFYDGYLSKAGVFSIPNKNKLQGTQITFKVSEEAMGKITLTADEVYQLIVGILYLTDINSTVNFTAIINGKPTSKKLVNTYGIESIIQPYIGTPLIKPVAFSGDNGTMKADVRFTFSLTALQPVVIGYSNFCPTANGTHINGLVDGIVKYFKDYMNKIYLKTSNKRKKNELTITTQDVRSTLIAVTSVAHLNPIFTGQAKDELANEDMYLYVKELVITGLKQWAIENNSDLMKVCKNLKDIAEIRLKSEGEKVKLVDKYKSSTLSKGLPDKFVPPNGNKELELIICEGDSAAGSFKNSRDNARQGIFPIRGKISNAIKATRKESLSNAEVAGILSIIGADAGTRKFNIDNVKWDKIIFATDADVDGGHISSLLLNMLLVHCPELITHGKVYKAIPPLYGINNGKKTTYLRDDMAYIDYVKKLFVKDNVLTDHYDKAISNPKVDEILYRNIDYVYYVNRVARAYSVHPELLELVCILTIENGLDIKKSELPKIRKRIKDRFRFVDVEIVNGALSVYGLVDNYTNKIYMNSRTIAECEQILLLLGYDYYIFHLNGELNTLYQVMNKFEGFKPKNIVRYKGLGEMNPSKLAESTLHPDGTRTLVRYTMSSAMQEINTIVDLEKDKKRIIEGVEVSRHDLA